MAKQKILYNEWKEDEPLPEGVSWQNVYGIGKPSNWADVTVNRLEKILYYLTYFHSLDGFIKLTSGTGAISMYSGGDAIQLETGDTSDSYANLRKDINYPPVQTTWDKNRMFHITVDLYLYDVNGCVGTGYTSGLGSWGNGGNFIGFRFTNKKLYARTQTNEANKTEVLLFDFSGESFPSKVFRLKMKFFAKERVEFFAEQVSVIKTMSCVITTNLPTGTANADTLLEFYIRNSVASNRLMSLSYFTLVQPG